MPGVIPLETLSIKLMLDSSHYYKGLENAEYKMLTTVSKFQGAADKLQQVGSKLALSLTLPLSVIGAGALRSFAAFEQGMRNVNSISHLTAETYNTLNDRVLKLSKSVPHTAASLTEGLYEIASSGYQGAAGFRVLEEAAKAASAGLSSTKVSAKAILGVLNAYGMSAAHAADVSDILFETVNIGILSFDDLAKQLGDVIAMSAAAKVPMDDVGAALASMTLAGLPLAESVTSLNRLLMVLMKPGKELQMMIKRLGYESMQTALIEKGLYGVMEDIRIATGGSAQTIIDLFTEIRAGRGAFALIAAQGRNYARTQKAIGDEANRLGATQRALDEQMKGFAYQMKLLFNSVTEVAIGIGQILAPKIMKLGKLVEQAIAWWDSLGRGTREFAVMAAVAAAALGPLLIAFGIFYKLTTMVIKAIFLPVTLFIKGIGWMVGVFTSAMKIMVKGGVWLGNILNKVFNAIGSAARFVVVGIGREFVIAAGIIRTEMGAALALLRADFAALGISWASIGGGIISIFVRMGQYIRQISLLIVATVSSFAKLSATIWGMIGPSVVRILSPVLAVVSAIQGSFVMAASSIARAFSFVWAAFRRDLAFIGRLAAAVFAQMKADLAFIGRLAAAVWTAMKRDLAVLGSIGKHVFNSMASTILFAWSKIPPAIKGPLITIYYMVRNNFRDLGRFIGTTFMATARIIQRTMTGAFRSIYAVGASIFTRLGGLMRSNMGFFSNSMRGLGSTAMMGVSMAGAYGLGGAFAPLLMMAPMVVTAIGSIAAAFAALLTPIGAVATASVGLGYYLLTSTESGMAALDYLGRQFGFLGDLAKNAVKGIGDAIRNGDWGAAGEIALMTLQVAWNQGLAVLMEDWGGWIDAIVETFVGGMKAVAKAWVDTQGAIAKQMVEAASADNWLGDLFKKIIGWDPKKKKEEFDQMENERLALLQQRNAQGGLNIPLVRQEFDPFGSIDTRTSEMLASIESSAESAMSGYRRYADPDKLKAKAKAIEGRLEFLLSEMDELASNNINVDPGADKFDEEMANLMKDFEELAAMAQEPINFDVGLDKSSLKSFEVGKASILDWMEYASSQKMKNLGFDMPKEGKGSDEWTGAEMISRLRKLAYEHQMATGVRDSRGYLIPQMGGDENLGGNVDLEALENAIGPVPMGPMEELSDWADAAGDLFGPLWDAVSTGVTDWDAPLEAGVAPANAGAMNEGDRNAEAWREAIDLWKQIAENTNPENNPLTGANL